MPDPASRPAHGEIGVWHARTADAWADPARQARAIERLSPADRVRYDRYHHDADRQMFLLGRTMARALVGRALGISPGAWTWHEGAYGRPEIGSPASPLSFNLAHSAGLVVCALSRDGDVGTDVEYRHRPPLDRRLVRRYCSPREAAGIEALGPEGWRDQFLRHWTLKEAYLKARGVGIAVHLADISFSIERDDVSVEFAGSLAGVDAAWAFLLTETAGSHFIAAAAPAPGGARPSFVTEPLPLDLLD
jgi:4'-phosphopantetheinyl transferase